MSAKKPTPNAVVSKALKASNREIDKTMEYRNRVRQLVGELERFSPEEEEKEHWEQLLEGAKAAERYASMLVIRLLDFHVTAFRPMLAGMEPQVEEPSQIIVPENYDQEIVVPQ